MIGKIKHLSDEFQGAVRAYRSRMYPEFLYKHSTDIGIPVFVYHHVRSDELRRQLTHLISNGYKTVDADTCFDLLSGKTAHDGKSVMLTFDDGFDDLYTTVFPLLKELECTVVVYLIAGWIGTEGMLNWNQIREMYESGCFDFQSHGTYHSSIFMDAEPVDVYFPGFDYGNHWNHPETKTGLSNHPHEGIRSGFPLFPTASRYSDKKRFYPGEEFIDEFSRAALDLYERQSSKRKKPDTGAILSNCSHPVRGRYETDPEQKEAVTAELLDAKKIIEQEVPGSVVSHFAFPWFEYGSITVKLLKEFGFKTAAIGLSESRQGNQPGDDPFTVVRVNGDFVTALPGSGRQGFFRIMLGKIVRRITAGSQA